MFRSLARGIMGQRLMSSVAATPKLSYPKFISFPAFPSIQPQTPSVFISTKLPLSNDVMEVDEEADNTLYTDSVLRKRRLKMKKHKLRKRRKAQKSLMQRLGKI
ncbi:hypothetical protein CLIB1423_04S02256 [[Candida] railenensis]|uniref:Small ribosomal subunit protein mS38 n=1 Tax=[Candida] railenensis TaxID=45579 RepID=A0A9P0QNC8_9ASCO|nr:hypothetical protein CLIB1423_04S02256 [[Candida] railenensis]